VTRTRVPFRAGLAIIVCLAVLACSGGPPAVTPSPVPTETLAPLPTPGLESPPPTAVSTGLPTELPPARGLYAQNRSEADLIVRLRGGLRRAVVVPAGQTGLVADAAALERPSSRIRLEVYDARCRRRLDRLGIVDEAVMLVRINRERRARLLAGDEALTIARSAAPALEQSDRC
jgi:hypothetical protein